MTQEKAKTVVRYSKKREAILCALRETKTHPTAEWLFQTLKPSFPDLSLGTVYRNLSFFQEHGQVKSVGVVNGQERFDADTSEHCHFICERCGKVVDLPQVSLNIDHALEESHGFLVTRQELNLYGCCELCQTVSSIIQ